LEQSIAAIREAEVLDATNPEVWVQVSFIFSPWFSPPTSRPQKTKTQKNLSSLSLFSPRSFPFSFFSPPPHQLGLYHDLLSHPTQAISSFIKALVFDPLSLPAQVHLARLYLLTPPKTNLALAHGILNSLTQGNGWDCSEAWYFLAKVCEVQEGREERVRECLEFGKRLEEGRCVRGLRGGSLERWI